MHLESIVFQRAELKLKIGVTMLHRRDFDGTEFLRTTALVFVLKVLTRFCKHFAPREFLGGFLFEKGIEVSVGVRIWPVIGPGISEPG
jgi:hypothetical protein